MTSSEPAPEPARLPLWQLRKAARAVVCIAQAHPLGLEVVAEVDGEIVRTQVARTADEAEAVAVQWRAAFTAKGWRG